jgi:hypothetical protein
MGNATSGHQAARKRARPLLAGKHLRMVKISSAGQCLQANLLCGDLAEGAAGGQLGGLDGGKGLAVNAEGVEAHGKEPKTFGCRDDDALRLAIDFYGDRPCTGGLVDCVLHEKCSCGASRATAGVLPGL